MGLGLGFDVGVGVAAAASSATSYVPPRSRMECLFVASLVPAVLYIIVGTSLTFYNKWLLSSRKFQFEVTMIMVCFHLNIATFEEYPLFAWLIYSSPISCLLLNKCFFLHSLRQHLILCYRPSLWVHVFVLRSLPTAPGPLILEKVSFSINSFLLVSCSDLISPSPAWYLIIINTSCHINYGQCTLSGFFLFFVIF